MEYRADCFHFRGDVPCLPHKRAGVHCDACPEYRPRAGRILLVKLGAAGDVIRTTPLLFPLQRDYPDHALTWVTDFPALVPRRAGDIRALDTATLLWLRHVRFELAINLDKDRQACALLREVTADRKIGFTLGDDGLCRPVVEDVAPSMAAAVRAKYLTGLFDDVNRACTTSYLQEIFAICGWEFAGEPYVIDRPEPAPTFDLPPARPLVGLNTGCGGRWTSRLWPEPAWAQLARDLRDAGLGVVLLGGPDEHAKNQRLAAATGACYPGHFELPTFIGLVDRCDLVVSAVTMAMHIALGLGKRLVLINNIFNPREFELYGRGAIVQPAQPCTCYFQPRCTAPSFCLDSLEPAAVQAAALDLLGRP